MADWLQQFSRTVKTCRLYDSGNPTVTQLRDELASGLDPILQSHGAAELVFSAETILLGETVVYAARSREDNLALPFFRDGIRALGVLPGIEKREVDALVDAMLVVTRPGGEESDLVTLLWEASLDHLTLRAVSTEGDVESGADGGGDDALAAGGPVAPWPRSGSGPSALAAGTGGADDGSAFDDTGRSDDRVTAGDVRELESSLLRLEVEADGEVERFRTEHEAERATPLARTGMRVIAGCLAQAEGGSERTELSQFLQRLLHEAVGNGQWVDAREGLRLLRDHSAGHDAAATFASELSSPESLTTARAWKRLESQTTEEHERFFAFASELGPAACDWVMQGLALSERRILRQGLLPLLTSLVREHPERLAPWLADERWYVVRNVVQVLGHLEGAMPIELIRTVTKHPEPRVRREVIAALARAPREMSRPVLMEMLRPGHEPLFASVLRALASEHDPEIATMLYGWLEQGSFSAWSEAERRAAYQALAVVGGEDVLPLLEPHLFGTRWFSKGNEGLRLASAMCLARIGTSAAREMLERGAKSRHSEVARACLAGLASLRSAPEATS